MNQTCHSEKDSSVSSVSSVRDSDCPVSSKGDQLLSKGDQLFNETVGLLRESESDVIQTYLRREVQELVVLQVQGGEFAALPWCTLSTARGLEM